jgi:hypothetical protein
MAENEQSTPEQQLLKLIEGQGVPGKAGPGAKSPAKPKGASFSFSRVRQTLAASLSFWKRGAKKRSYAAKRAMFTISEVNKALVVATGFLFLYVVFDAVASARNLQRPTTFAPMKDGRPKIPKETVAPLEETSYYLQKVGARDIFREGKKQESAVQQAPSAAVVTEDAEAVRSLALVGISWSSNPDAIIEDKSKQRTYFVKRGQEVGDGVKVEAIFKDHVVVTYEDREYELR